MENANHSKDLFQKVFREFEYNCLEVDIGRDYKESTNFQEAVLYFIFNLCELNPTNKVGEIIHKFLKLSFSEEPDQRRGIYNPIISYSPSFGAIIKRSNVKSKKNYRFLLTN